MPRYKLIIAYDGTDFCGWQKQEPFQTANSRWPIAHEGRPAPESDGAESETGGAGAAASGESLESFDPREPVSDPRAGRATDPVAHPRIDPKAPTPPVPRGGDPPAGRKAEIQGIVQRSGEDRPRVQLRTVQHVVERAVREIVREPVGLLGASRTDAGVHARGQVAAFTCGGEEAGDLSPPAADGAATVRERAEDRSPAGHPPLPDGRGSVDPRRGAVDPGCSSGHSGWPVSRGLDKLIRAINGKLPEDVIVLSAEPVAAEFDPVMGPVAKAYSYTLHVSRTRPLWDRRYVHQIWEELDVPLMRGAAERIVGEHDFVAFAAAGHGRLTTVRTVFGCEVVELPAVDGEPRLRIEVSGSGFLYNMVRIIAGTLVECGRGRMTADDVARAIESKDRRNAGPTLPASGLCLEWIRYG